MPTEIETLHGFLDAQRRGVLAAVEGLPDDSLRRPVLPSGWTCLGMLQHLTVNERYWLRWAVGGEQIPGTELVDGQCRVALDGMPDQDNDWLVAPEMNAETVLGRYREEAALANLAIADVPVDSPPRQVDPPWVNWFGTGGPTTVRWILLHMIEETAQHLGHLDVVRELLEDEATSAGR